MRRDVSLGGRLGPHDYWLAELLTRLGVTPAGSDEDFLTAAALLDAVTIQQLARELQIAGRHDAMAAATGRKG